MPGTRLAAAALLLLGLPALVAGDVEVRAVGEKVEVRATAAPLSEVLDRLARQTGMRLSYDGGPPRARVSLAGGPRTPVEAVLAALEGHGLTYALRMDATGTRPEMLVVFTGGASRATGGSPSVAGRTERERPEASNEAEEDDAPSETAPAPEPSPEARPFTPGSGSPPSGRAMPLMLPPQGDARPVMPQGAPTTAPSPPG